MTARFSDRDMAGKGAATIAWARRGMPLLDVTEARLVGSGALKGLRVGISLVLEPKTANLALALRNAGATVTVTASAGSIADASVIPALEAEGIAVFATPDGSSDEDLRQTRAFLATAPQILIDDGAQVTRLAHKECPDLVAQMIGATSAPALMPM